MTSVLHCQDISVDYRKIRAIDGVSCQFNQATMTAIIGPNGGGKSTLLKILKGFIAPVSGAIVRSGLATDQIAYLPQNSEIDRSFPISVSEVVAMGLTPQVGYFSKLTEQDHHTIQEALRSVGMDECADRSIGTLSGGQFQRVLFARIAVQNARVILLDEPFAAIDAPTMEILARLLRQWQQEGRTVIAVLHDLDIVREYFPSTLVMARQLIAYGPTQDVLTIETLRKAKAYSNSWDFCRACEETENQEAA